MWSWIFSFPHNSHPNPLSSPLISIYKIYLKPQSPYPLLLFLLLPLLSYVYYVTRDQSDLSNTNEILSLSCSNPSNVSHPIKIISYNLVGSAYLCDRSAFLLSLFSLDWPSCCSSSSPSTFSSQGCCICCLFYLEHSSPDVCMAQSLTDFSVQLTCHFSSWPSLTNLSNIALLPFLIPLPNFNFIYSMYHFW